MLIQNPLAPIQLLRIHIPQLVRGDFFDSIGQTETSGRF
jgi:hypothetical protein